MSVQFSNSSWANMKFAFPHLLTFWSEFRFQNHRLQLWKAYILTCDVKATELVLLLALLVIIYENILSWTLFCSKSQLRPKGLTWFSLGRCMDAQCYTLDTVRRWYHRKNWWQWGWIKKRSRIARRGEEGRGLTWRGQQEWGWTKVPHPPKTPHPAFWQDFIHPAYF